MNDAARWPVLHDVLSARVRAQPQSAPSAWRSEPERLTLLNDSAELPALLAEAASWAERISVCVTAPESERGSSPWWRELLARHTKLEAAHVRRAVQAEPWLLQRLHGAGTLRLVEAGGKQAASNLLVFARGAELRALLSHIPLERAVVGAAFGTLLCFQGSSHSEFGRACRTQIESWTELGRIPTGSELDTLLVGEGRREPAPLHQLPRPLGVLTDAGELAAALAAWIGSTDGGASVRAIAGGYRVSLERRGEPHAPWAVTLRAGAGWASGNALLLDVGGGRSLLVWRGALLGHSPARSALMWSEARLPTFELAEARLGLAERVAVIAYTDAPLGPQLAEFTRELTRLARLFGVEPAPVIGHVLAEFSALSDRQQTRLIWRALIGLGELELERATRSAAAALRDQGYLQSDDLTVGSAALASLAERIERAADSGRDFDRPGPGRVRAVQPDLSSYLLDDWLACLLGALPEDRVVARRTALRAAFERACSTWGLAGERLRRNGAVERALESCVSYASCRGLLLRVGAGGLKRPGRAGVEAPSVTATANGGEPGFVAGWARAIESLAPVQRLLVTRRAGWYGPREALQSIAERLGLTLERARQIELETWRQIEASSGWAGTLRSRLAQALGEARSVSVQQLTLEDAWWRGVEQRVELLDAVFESLCDGALCRVEIGAPDARRALVARFSQAELDHAFDGLLEQAARVPLPAALDTYHTRCQAAAAALDPDLCEDLREALEARLELDPENAARAMGWANAADAPRPSARDAVDSEALLRLDDVLRSVFRAAGTPLSLGALTERVNKRLDADAATLAARLGSPPFVERNADQYGLIARDVPGGHESIASVLNDVTEALTRAQRALGSEEVAALAEARVKRAWSPELVRSLISGDPALHLSPALETTLRCWEQQRPLFQGAPLCPGVPASLRPRFETLAQQPLPEALRPRLGAELRRLEHAADLDDRSALPLARQLCDLSERLLEHAAGAPPEAQQLTHAAICCVLDALAPDEETPDAPPVDGDALASARAVMAAVLHWLDLDWLERSPRGERPLNAAPGAQAASAQSGTPTRYNAPSPSLEM